ncbi:MAG: prepilin-type N-terminal cleavage/methylation domain-containing protein [Armatimonadetes bacterium]|nr:prepilin-type N-terminal cleavage/methylation domain-containing protein [Armatimonadota bacterium]
MKTRRGFTFAEIMVCLLLLSIAVLGLVSVQIFSFKATVQNEKQHIASLIARTVMAEAEHKLDLYFNDATLSTGAAVPAPGHDGFNYAVLAPPELDDDDDGLRQVEVTVMWQDAGGEHRYRIETLLYDTP